MYKTFTKLLAPKQVPVWNGMPLTGNAPYYRDNNSILIMQKVQVNYAALPDGTGQLGLYALTKHSHFRDFGSSCTSCKISHTGLYCDEQGNVLA